MQQVQKQNAFPSMATRTSARSGLTQSKLHKITITADGMCEMMLDAGFSAEDFFLFFVDEIAWSMSRVSALRAEALRKAEAQRVKSLERQLRVMQKRADGDSPIATSEDEDDEDDDGRHDRLIAELLAKIERKKAKKVEYEKAKKAKKEAKKAKNEAEADD